MAALDPPARKIRLVVEYDGTGLHGWQRQLNGPTVQQHLEEALEDLLGAPTPVTGASRTDAGVHARGQVCAFATARTIPTHGIQRALNARLPAQIAIVDAREVDAAFHPRFAARGKHYRYTLWTRHARSPRWRDRAWHYGQRPLALEAMRAAGEALVGEHDFAAFRAVGCSAKTTLRRVDQVAVGRDADLVTVDVLGNAFLRNMVRIIVGTLVEVGSGARPVSEVAEILASRDRTRAGITAPPHGLELLEVRY